MSGHVRFAPLAVEVMRGYLLFGKRDDVKIVV